MSNDKDDLKLSEDERKGLATRLETLQKANTLTTSTPQNVFKPIPGTGNVDVKVNPAYTDAVAVQAAAKKDYDTYRAQMDAKIDVTKKKESDTAAGKIPHNVLGLNADKISLIPFPFIRDEEAPGILDNVKFRVFIMGVEVSDYLQDVSWSSDASSEMIGSTASLSLKAPRNLFTYTKKNLTENNGGVNWVISDDFRVDESIKKSMYAYKKANNFYDRDTLTGRWNISIGSLCINHGDTIRIFSQIPWTQKDAWLPVFTGYVREPSINRNHTGEDQVNLSCYTLAEKLTKARVLSKLSAAIVDPKNSPEGSKLGDSKQYFYGKSGITTIDMNQIMLDSFGGTASSMLLDTTLEGLLKFIFYGDTSQANTGYDHYPSDVQIAEAKEKYALALKANEKAVNEKAVNELKMNVYTVTPAEQERLIKQTKSALDKAATDYASLSPDLDPTKKNTQIGFLSSSLYLTHTFPATAKQHLVVTSDENKNPTLSSSSTISTSRTVYKKSWPTYDHTINAGGGFKELSGKRTQPHSGIDTRTVVNGKSAPISLRAPIDGFIYKICSDFTSKESYGAYIQMEGDDGSFHTFAHLSLIIGGLSGHTDTDGGTKGTRVTLGQDLGMTGKSGDSRGAGGGFHLHWEIRMGGPAGGLVNPAQWVDSNNSQGNTFTSNPIASDNSANSAAALNWDLEVADMANWKASNLVGWANGTEDFSNPGNVVDYLRAPIALPQFNPDGTLITGSSFTTQPLKAKEIAFNRTDEVGRRVYLTNKEVTIIGQNSGWLGIYSPHGSCVAVALKQPVLGWGMNRGFTPEVDVQQVGFQAGTQTKAQILSELLGRLDYYWYVTGNGDFVFEFPGYEMCPTHCGAAFEPEFSFSNLVQNDTLTENFANLKAMYTFIGCPTYMNASAGATGINRLIQVSYKLPTVAVRNGVEIEEIYCPFITNEGSLAVYGAIKIREAIANSFTYSCSSLPPMLYVTPNTPIYLKDIDTYALVKKVSFSANIASASFKSTLEFTALRQRLTDEQLFIRFNSEVLHDTANKLATSVSVSSQALSSAKSIANSTPVKPDDPLITKLNKVLNQYGYIYGNGDLLIDYFNTYNQNALSMEQYRVDVASSKQAVRPSATITFESNANRLISTPKKDASNITRPKTSHFTEVTDPDPETKASVVKALAEAHIPGDAAAGMMAHMNTETNNQPGWFDSLGGFTTNLSKTFEQGIGILNLTGKAIGQLTNVAGAMQNIVADTQRLIGAQSNLIGDMASAQRNIKAAWDGISGTKTYTSSISTVTYSQTTKTKTVTPISTTLTQPNQVNLDPSAFVALDPRANVAFSCKVGAMMMKEAINQVIQIHGAHTNLSGTDINRDVLALAIKFGPHDPAYRKTIKDTNPLDVSEAGTDAFIRKLQQNLYLLGTYSKKDIDYCSFYRRIRNDAKKRGLHKV